MTTERPVWRRLLAIVALVGAGILAWQTAQHRDRDVEISWILTHVELRAGEALVDRGRLVGVDWAIGRGGKPSQWTSRGSALFAVGDAPEVSGPHKARIPADAPTASVTCTYELAGQTRVRTRATVALPTTGGDRWTVDIGTCGQL